jgi:hypothetical protein
VFDLDNARIYGNYQKKRYNTVGLCKCGSSMNDKDIFIDEAKVKQSLALTVFQKVESFLEWAVSFFLYAIGFFKRYTDAVCARGF